MSLASDEEGEGEKYEATLMFRRGKEEEPDWGGRR
jgi:hypothetical protein